MDIMGWTEARMLSATSTSSTSLARTPPRRIGAAH
jgi:hypothetical protein